MFEPFPKLTRFSQDWTITEKIDGSNGQIWIDPLASENDKAVRDMFSLYEHDGLRVIAGSRSRFLIPTKNGDHMGFARWVEDNAPDLIETLGPGRHFGEWWGKGIQRGYDLDEKRFSLFNVSRWHEDDVQHIPGLHVVPVIGGTGMYLDEPGKVFHSVLEMLKAGGSFAAPGYMNPEGIVMYHGRSGTLFKKTFDYDEEGKWAQHEQLSSENAAEDSPRQRRVREETAADCPVA